MTSTCRNPVPFALAACLLAFLLPGAPHSAQDPWVTFYGGAGNDYAYGVAEVPGGGFVAVGNTQSTGAGDFDFWLFRTDAQGSLLWEKVLGGPLEDKAYSVAVTPAGEIYAAGRTGSFGAGSLDIWVVKLDAQGQVLWQKAYGGTGLDFMWPGGVVVTEDGGCALAGSTESFGKGIKDVLLLRLNPDGTVRWQKTYGGTNDDRAHALCLSPEGDFVIAGYTKSFGAGGLDGWLLKVSSTGMLQWQKSYGGRRDDWFYSVAPVPGGGYAVAGSTMNGKTPAQWDFLVLMVSEDGEPLWERTLGGPQEDSAIAVSASLDGSLTACGQTKSGGTGIEFDAWVTTFDSAGDLRSQRRYFGNQDDFAYGIIPVSDGGFLMAGRTLSYGNLVEDAWLFRLGEDASPGTTCVSSATTTWRSDPAAFPAAVTPGIVMIPSVTVTVTDAQTALPFSTAVSCCTLSCSAGAFPETGDAPLTVGFDAEAHSSHCTGETAYFWTFGDGDQTSGQSVTHTFTSPGTYTWTLTAVVDGISCRRTGTVIVDAPCSLTCDATASATVGQAPFSATFASTLWPRNCQGEASYLWDFGDGGTSDLATPQHTFATPGTFTWSMTVNWDGATCSDQGTLLVTEPCTMTCSASASPDSEEVPMAITFASTVSHSYCNDAFVYHWDFGDGGTSTEMKPVHTYLESGTFGWTLTITSGNTSCSAQGSVTALPACLLACEASVTPPSGALPLTVGYSVSATAEHCTQPQVVLWDFGDGTTSSAPSGTHTYGSPGTYAWKVDVTSGKGTCRVEGSLELRPGLPGDCDGDGSVSIGEVQKAVTMFLGLVSPDCGVDCNGDGTVSIGEVQKVINAFLGLPSSC